MVRPTALRLTTSSVLPVVLAVTLATYSILAATHPYRDQRLATSLLLFGASVVTTLVAGLLWPGLRWSGVALTVLALLVAAAAVYVLIH